MAQCESASRLHEARVAIGYRHRDAGSDKGALAWSDHGVMARHEIESGVTRVRVRRQREFFVHAFDCKLHCGAPLTPDNAATHAPPPRCIPLCSRPLPSYMTRPDAWHRGVIPICQLSPLSSDVNSSRSWNSLYTEANRMYATLSKSLSLRNTMSPTWRLSTS